MEVKSKYPVLSNQNIYPPVAFVSSPFETGKKYITRRIEFLKKNMGKLEKDLHSMGDTAAQIRRKMTIWSGN